MTSPTSDDAGFALPERPALGRHLAAHVVAGEGVALRGERTSTVLTAPIYERLSVLLDGAHTSDEIADLLEAQHDPAEVFYAIATLAAALLVVRGEIAV